MWPVSWAITPISWLAFSDRSRRPVWMNRFWPWATKALRLRSLTRITRTALGSSPAAFQSGVPNVRMIVSISVSRIRANCPPPCARAGGAIAAMATAPATIVATKRLNKDLPSLSLPLTKRRPRRRQLKSRTGFLVRSLVRFTVPIGGLVLLSAIAACSSGGLGIGGGSVGYLGAVVADEPHAAQIGREVLDLGGSAGDAAVATYFALSVTMPSTAGLGGGGVCVAYAPDSKRMEVIDFLPRPTAGGGMAVPTNVRGMALLHSRFGRQPWGQLLGSAESLARIGTEVSRAFARDLSQPELAGHLDRSLQQIFTDRDGNPVREGDQVKQQDLAGSLARIRAIGAGDFYNGGLARQLVDGARAAGGDLTLDDLRRFVPQRIAPLNIPLGNHRVLLPPGAGGAVAADLL